MPDSEKAKDESLNQAKEEVRNRKAIHDMNFNNLILEKMAAINSI